MAKLIGNQFLELNAVVVDENAITEEKFKITIMVDNITGITPTIRLTSIDGTVIGKNHPDIHCIVTAFVRDGDSTSSVFCEDTYEDIIFELNKLKYV